MAEFVESTLYTQVCQPVLTILQTWSAVSPFDCWSVSILTAAPPAMVPNNIGLISMTFFTVCDAIQLPAVALESVATIMPPLNRKANVVVP